MLLAGDIGGTKSRLAVFADSSSPRTPLVEEVLPSGRFAGVEALLCEFLKGVGYPVDRVCLAIAGPVIDDRAAVTNLPWIADSEGLRRTFGFRSVTLLNDLAATARSVPLLTPADLRTLSPGEPVAGGAIALIAPGTGLGEAFLTWDGRRYCEHASEGGHSDFAPPGPLAANLLKALALETNEVNVEMVCSGPGIRRIYGFCKDRGEAEESDWLAERLSKTADPAAVISAAAQQEKDALCVRTMNLFLEILGAEAANLALKVLATGGVYLAGGIAPRLLSLLEEGLFLSAFRRKGRMADLLFRMPVHVILEPRAALIGAADRGLAQ
jgi:glucokinase